MFIYICQTPPHFQFTRKLNNWNSEKVYLVVCGCLMVFCGRLLGVCVHLLVVCGRLLAACGHLLMVCDGLCSFVLVCDGLCSFVAVARFSNYGLEYDMQIWQIFTRALESLKFGFWWDPVIQSKKYMSLKFTDVLCVVTMKNDAKFEEELTCRRFKIDMRNLTNFDTSTQKFTL